MVNLSLVIPAYNEEKILAATAQKYADYFSMQKTDYEIILVPNNCTDNTPQVAESLAKKNPRIRTITIPNYVGKGGAVKKGFENAKGNLIGFVDADNSVSPEEFGKLITASKQHKVIIASRAMPDSIIPVNQSPQRKLLGTAFRYLVNGLFSLDVMDSQCGGKLFNAAVLKKVLPELKNNGWEFDVELLWKIKRACIPIHEIGIIWNDSGASKVGLLDPLKMFLGIVQMRLQG